MRLFKATYKARDGSRKETRKWYVELTDHRQIVRRFVAFEDKRMSEALGRQIERLIRYRAAGEQPDPQLSQWLERIPDSLRSRFVSIDLLDSTRAAGSKPLLHHLEDFKRSMLDKGDTAKQAQQVTMRANAVIHGCGFKGWSDIRADRVERYLAERRSGASGISAQTSNFYLSAMKAFCRWMVQNRRAAESPLAHLKRLNVKVDRRHDRVTFEVEEVQRLLAATTKGPEQYGMDGRERAMLYRLAVESGLRANELRTLTVDSFNLTSCTVTVVAAYSKHRQEDTLPLRPETAEELRVFFAGKTPGAKAFGGRYKSLTAKTADMIREDLAATVERDVHGTVIREAIAYTDAAGRFRDFHALRHTTGSWLAACGVHPKTIQTIMRHGDINLTMTRYGHSLRGQTAEAVSRLPNLDLPDSQSQKATGTDGKGFVLASCLAGLGAQPFTTMHQPAQGNPAGAITNGVFNCVRRDSNTQPSVPKTDALSN
jgi:integrase